MSRTGTAAPALRLALVVCESLLLAPGNATAALPPAIRRHQAVRVQARPLEGAAPRALRFRAFGRTLDLELEPSPLLAPDAETVTVSRGRARREPTAPELFRGRVAGDAGSSVRLAIRGPTVLGSIRLADDTWYLEPLRHYEPGAADDLTLVYRASDLDASALGPLGCASTAAVAPRSTESGSSTGASPEPSGEAQPLRLLELTLVADAPFFARHGADSVAAMLVVVDRVAQFLEQDAGITIAVARTFVYETPADDPLTTSTDTFELFASLNEAQLARPDTLGAGDALHLFTGRELDGNIAGIAYVGSVCRGSAISLSQDVGNDLHVRTLLAGHELGHTLGAWHDGETGPCAAAPSGYVMWPSLEASTVERLSGCSSATIAPVVEAAACLSSATPPGCGNGMTDDGEQCDDGAAADGDCCRSDCRYDGPGASCAADGNACTADVCDGSGTCVHPPSSGACDDDDACTTNGLCVDGACRASGIWRPLASSRLKASFGPATGRDRLQVHAALPAELLSPPTVAGVTLRFLDESGRIITEIAAPALEWRDRKGTGRRYAFETAATAALAAEALGASRMSLRFVPASATAKLRMTLTDTDVSFLAGRGGVGLQLLVGDSATGDCGTVLSMYCNGTDERLSCD